MKRHWPRFTVARRLVGAGFLLAFALAVRGDLAWFRGGPVATRSFGVLPLVDPLAALELVLAGGGVPLQVVVGAGVLLLAAALLGPVFCGWVCPLGFLLDLGDAVRRRALRSLHRPLPPAVALPRGLRPALLGATLGAAAVAGGAVFTPWSPIRSAAEAVGTGAPAAIAVVAALLVAEWFAPRLWCRALCPLGALYSFVGAVAPLRVRIAAGDQGKLACRLCTRSCTMGLRVMEDHALRGAAAVDDPACTRCGSCVDACPGGVLRLGCRSRTRADGQAPAAPSSSSASAQSCP
ncbi:MAG: 4Fe-4S binding protein [Planctomycetota bacterium]